MNRSVARWLIFGTCLLVLIGALSWTTFQALSLEDQQVNAATEARLREQVRLALWRMEAEASSVVVRESARPALHYQTFPEVAALVNGKEANLSAVEIREPSPLLGTTPDLVKLHFQCQPISISGPGGICSPQVPLGEEREIALTQYEVAPEIAEAEERMLQMERLLARHRQWEEIAGFKLMAVSGKTGTAFVRREDGTQATIAASNSWGTADQILRDNSLVKKPIEQTRLASQPPTKKVATPSAYPTDVPGELVGDMNTLWLGGELLLLRQVMEEQTLRMQGVWLDWPELEKRLLASISDLLPNAQLLPIQPEEVRDDWRALVTLPVRLEPGLLPPTATAIASPPGLKPSLGLAWACLLGTSVAIGYVLHRTIQLSERRAAFVSAVTHELRTPLTTFRLYSEMLAEGVVTEEVRRREYLQTLCDESDRLSRLVENVLTFSRIERTNSPPEKEPIDLDEFLGRLLPRLRERCREASLELKVQLPDLPAGSTLQSDALVLEQVLFNLVDNAAKYAAPQSDPKELHLDITSDADRWLFCVRDFGPGLSTSAIRKLFQPFCKSASEAADTALGVGLGLALCRRLARQLGGDLKFRKPDDGRGAAFTLSLPGG